MAVKQAFLDQGRTADKDILKITWGENLGPQRMEIESAECFTMMNFIVCTMHLI